MQRVRWEPELEVNGKGRKEQFLRLLLFCLLSVIVLSPPPHNSEHIIRTYPTSRMEHVKMETDWECRAPDILEDSGLEKQIEVDMEVERERLSRDYTDDDLFCLAAAICQEAGGDAQSDYTRELVGLVVMNRVASDKFPDSIREVLISKNQYGKFYWTGVKFPSYGNQKMIDRAYKIAENILSGRCKTECPRNVIWQSSFRQGDGVFKISDGIYFCYSD